MGDIYNFLIPIPPTVYQDKVVKAFYSILPQIERYGDAQNRLDKLNSEVKGNIQKSILQEAIQGRLASQDLTDEPVSSLLERIRVEKQKLLKEGKLKKKDIADSIIFKGEDNKYYEKVGDKVACIEDDIPFEIPKSWSWARLGVLVSNETGLAYSKDSLSEKSERMIRVLRGGNIDEGKWTIKDDDVIIAAKYVREELILKQGTFITPAVTSIEKMAKTALIDADQTDVVVGGFVLMLKPFLKDDGLLQYLNLFFGKRTLLMVAFKKCR